MIKFLFSILFIILFSGCIGIGVVHPTLYKENYFIGKSYENVKSKIDMELLSKNNNIITYKRKKDEFKYAGVVPMIGIGIPLILPIGYVHEYYVFKNNICIEESIESTTWNGFMCGLLNENGKMGCDFLK